MKSDYPRIMAAIIIATLMINGYLAILPEPSRTTYEDVVDDEPFLGQDSRFYRPTRAGTDWPMFNFDARNTAYTTDTGPITDDWIWYNQTGGGTYSSPAVVNGKVYISSEDGSSSYGFLSCYYADNGTRAWRFRTYASVSGGYGLTSTPAVENGYVFFGGDRIYCLYENNGTEKWTVNTGNSNYGDGAPTVANGKLFMPACDRRLYCIDQETGTVIWRTQAFTGGSDNYGLFAAPAVVNGHVYQAACNGVVYKFDENGQPSPPSNAIINHSFTMAYTSYTAPVVANGRVFVGCGYGFLETYNRFYCLDATDLTEIWQFYPGSATSFFGSASFYNDRIYVPSRDGNLYCLDAMSAGPTPTEYWRIGLSGEVWSSPAITDDRLYVGSWSNYIYCINLSQPATPFYYWRYNTLGNVDSSPAVVDGKVYVGTHGNSGRIYCFGTPPITPSIDRIEIETQASGSGIAIPDQTVDVGMEITGYAAAYNGTDYLYDVQVNWSVSNGIGPNASTNPTFYVTNSDFYSGFYGGTATWIADDGKGNTDQVQFTIRDPGVDEITIVDSPNNLGSEIPDQPIDVGQTIQGYAAAFNDTIGYLNDILVDWSVLNISGPNASTSPTSSVNNSIFYSGYFGGTATWIVNDGNGNTDQVQFTIRDPGVDYIIIVDNPNTGASEIQDRTVDVGFEIEGYAAAYNKTIHYLGDSSVTWSVINTSGAQGYTIPISGASSTLNVGLKGGTVKLIADYGSGRSDSVNFTVNPPTINRIIIRTGPNGSGSWVGDSTYIYGDSDTFYAAGYNYTADWVEDVPALWNCNDSFIGSVTPGPSNSTTFSVLNNGTCKVNATYNLLLNSTGVIKIINYTVGYIIIRDSPNNGGAPIEDLAFNIGETAVFYAAAYNQSAPGGGYLGDVGVTWECSNDSIAIVTTPGISTLFSVLFRGGVCNVTARYGPSIFNVTGNLAVLPPTLNEIIITSEPDGDELANVFLDADDSILMFASGYNITGPTYLGLIDVNWTQTNSIGSFSQLQGNSTTFTAGMLGGTTLINATNISLDVSDDFMLNINDLTIDYIQIRDSPGGSGNIVTTKMYSIFEIDEFYAAAYNKTAQYLYDVSVLWSSDNSSVGQVTSPGNSTIFNAQQVGSNSVCTITATYSALIDNSTGLLSVLAPTIDSIRLTYTPDGTPVTDLELEIQEPITLYASAYNSTGSIYMGLIEVDWSVLNSLGSFNNLTGTSTIFTAGLSPGQGSISGRNDALNLLYDFDITILEPTVNYIVITDAPNGEELVTEYLDVGESILIYASGFNNTGSTYVGLVEVVWSQTSSIGSFDPNEGSSTTFTAGLSGGFTFITAGNSVLSVNDDFRLIINDPTIDSIKIRDEPGDGGNEITAATFTLDENDNATYYCASYNATVGYLGDVSADWAIDNDIGEWFFDQGTFTIFTAKKAGNGNLTATVMGMVKSISIVVNPATDDDGTPSDESVVNESAEGTSSNEITINWDQSSVPNLAGYIIQRSTSPDGPWENITILGKGATFYTDTELEPGTTYYYQIIAFDNENNESPPTVVSATTLARSETSKEEFPWAWGLLLVIIIVVVVLILFFFVFKKKRKVEEEHTREAIPKQVQPPPSWMTGPKSASEEETPPAPPWMKEGEKTQSEEKDLSQDDAPLSEERSIENND